MGAGNAAAAKRAYAAAAHRAREAKRAEYDEYRAEARACGFEVESFAEWLGETSARQLAEDRMGWSSPSIADACYYGDTY
jgi:hypothetical protein